MSGDRNNGCLVGLILLLLMQLAVSLQRLVLAIHRLAEARGERGLGGHRRVEIDVDTGEIEQRQDRRRPTVVECPDQDHDEPYIRRMIRQERCEIEACHHGPTSRQPVPDLRPLTGVVVPTTSQSNDPVQSCRETQTETAAHHDIAVQTGSDTTDVQVQTPVICSSELSTQTCEPILVDAQTQTRGIVADSPAIVQEIYSTPSGPVGTPEDQLPTGDAELHDESPAVSGTQQTQDSGYRSAEPDPVDQPVQGATHLEVLNRGCQNDLDPDPDEEGQHTENG